MGGMDGNGWVCVGVGVCDWKWRGGGGESSYRGRLHRALTVLAKQEQKVVYLLLSFVLLFARLCLCNESETRK